MRAEPPPLPPDLGAAEGARVEAVGLRGADEPELTPGLVREVADRGTITGPCARPPADGGTTRLTGAR